MQATCLYVDDDPTQLSLMAKTLCHEFRVLTASSPERALKILEDTDAHVILVDYMMPEMTGIDLIERARKIRPESVYVVVSAYSDREYILDALKRGHVFDYVLKPWRRSDLIKVLEDAFSDYQERQSKAERLRSLEQERDALARKAGELESVRVEKEKLSQALKGYLTPDDPEEDGRVLLQSIERAKKLSLKETLKKAEGNISEAARMLDLPISTLYYRLKKYGLLQASKHGLAEIAPENTEHTANGNDVDS
jgi:DNA-binding NtrC family response regulator